jgi:hypothetical protein
MVVQPPTKCNGQANEIILAVLGIEEQYIKSL